MDSLRLVDVAEGGDLVLMTGDGRRFTLAVDDELRAAVRRERLREPVGETRPGPREVQARVRGGETAEEIADQTGVDVDYVRRFEGAILAERQHVARLARGSTMDRGAAGPVSLEEATLEVLAAEGVTAVDVSWDSRKLEGSRWEVRADWRTGRAQPSARWRFDLSTRVLEPVGAEAERISGRDRQQRRLSAVRDSVFDVEQAVTTAVPTSPARAVGGTVELLDALARQRGRRPLSVPLTPSAPRAAEVEAEDGSEAGTEAADDCAPERAVEPSEDQELPTASAAGQDAAGQEAAAPGAAGQDAAGQDAAVDGPAEPDLLSVLGLETTTPTDSDEAAPPSTAPPATPAAAADAGASRSGRRLPPVAGAGERRPSSRRRSSVPSWDDIVFGTRRDEDGSP